MKSYQIILNQEEIYYDVIYKHMNSIRMRVKQGKLVVSAPYYTPRSLIEDNIRKYHEQYLYVYHQNIAQCVENYLKRILLNYIEEKIIYYLAYDFDLNMPRIEIKKYKGRWGSCYYKEGKVSFNLSLIHLDKELIDYVIVHELTHFLQANHSTLFYQEIAKRMPDYKERLKRLKEKHV